MGGVEEISSNSCKFFKCEKLVLQVFWKYQVSRWKCLEESSSNCWEFQTLKFKKVCGREFFDYLNVWGVWNRGLWVVENIKLKWGVKDFFQSFQSFEKSVYCSIYFQNVFFSNGMLESHGEVWWWQLSPFEIQNAHDVF